jgi:hypothetical protein
MYLPIWISVFHCSMGLNKGRQMPGAGQIGPYHNKVASDIKDILGEVVTFFPPKSKEKLDKIDDGDEVVFEIVHRDPTRSERATRMRREDSKKHRVAVFPLCTNSSLCAGTFWVSWYEAWLKQNSSKLVLLNAGWTMFEGLPGDQQKTQVLRVDWDQLPRKGSMRAGQPHWHFDDELFIPAEPDKVQIKPGLVEVPPDEAFAVPKWTSVGFIHLAMGTWNKNTAHPLCWQRTYEDDCRQLRDWCVKTLRYLKEQVSG